MPRTSDAVCSFFKSQVRVVPPPENASFVQVSSVSVALWTLTSENVTYTAFASTNGASLIIMLKFVFDGLDGELHAIASAIPEIRTLISAIRKRMKHSPRIRLWQRRGRTSSGRATGVLGSI